LVLLDDAKPNAGILLNLLLEMLGKRFVASVAMTVSVLISNPRKRSRFWLTDNRKPRPIV